MVRRCIVVGLLFVALGAEAQDDASESSAGSSDAGSSDVGSSDVGSSDTGSSDTGSSDVGSSDVGASNAGSSNAGASNAGASNAGASNAGASNAGASNAGASSEVSVSAGSDPTRGAEAGSEPPSAALDAEGSDVEPPSAPADVDPAALARRASVDDRPERLELALEYAAFAFDAPSFLAAQRAALVAIYEAYCGLGNLLQNEPNTTEIVVGIGCLLGAATLTYVAYRGFARPAGPAAARARYDRFYDARREGLTFEELAATEDALEAAARADRRRRIVGGVFGALNFVAAAVLFGLVARDQLDSRVGTSVGIGTTVVGVLGVTALAIRGPSERALALYRR